MTPAETTAQMAAIEAVLATRAHTTTTRDLRDELDDSRAEAKQAEARGDFMSDPARNQLSNRAADNYERWLGL